MRGHKLAGSRGKEELACAPEGGGVFLTLIFSSGPGADAFDFLGMMRILWPASNARWRSSASSSLRLLPLLRTSTTPRLPDVGLVDGLPARPGERRDPPPLLSVRARGALMLERVLLVALCGVEGPLVRTPWGLSSVFTLRFRAVPGRAAASCFMSLLLSSMVALVLRPSRL